MAGLLEGEIAVVTGGSRGIGRAIAQALAQEGAAVALCGRDRAQCERTVRELSAGAPGRLLGLGCDVAVSDEVDRFADDVRRLVGRPGLLFNNAGLVARGRLDEQEPGDWRAVIEANLMGSYFMTRAFLGDMRRARRGRIVNIASISGRKGTPRLTAYCAAKHAVVGMTRALAEEVRDDGIQVNAICPGSVDTRMLEGSGFSAAMTADDIARVALFLATTAPAALTGSCLDVFG